MEVDWVPKSVASIPSRPTRAALLAEKQRVHC